MVLKVGNRTIAKNGSRECLGCLQGSHQKKDPDFQVQGASG